MRIIRRGETADLIVGTGLVGDSVAQAARLLRGVSSDVTVPTAWGETTALQESLALAASTVRASLPQPQRLRVFWCAGKAGFGSNAEQCAAELRSFETVLEWAQSLTGVEFHLTSSAGGLHEGQLLVSDAASARTPRPYAELKLQQERALHASTVPARFVYRLSSVYGVPLPGRRLGLVSTMVMNALRHRSTLITAHASTQRDFVAAIDVGSFMAREGKSSTRSEHDGVHYLVSGRPLSIWALQVALERHLFAPVPVHYTTGKDNFESTTFSPSLRPAQWSVSSIEANLPSIVSAMLGRAHG